jgi:hypothetical protein
VRGATLGVEQATLTLERGVSKQVQTARRVGNCSPSFLLAVTFFTGRIHFFTGDTLGAGVLRGIGLGV